MQFENEKKQHGALDKIYHSYIPVLYLYVGAAELKKRVDFELLMKLECGNLI